MSLQDLTTSVPAHQRPRSSLYGRLEQEPERATSPTENINVSTVNEGVTIEEIHDEVTVSNAPIQDQDNVSINLDTNVFAAETTTTSNTRARTSHDGLPEHSIALRDALRGQGVSVAAMAILADVFDVMQEPMNITVIEREDLREAGI
jgi:hypothetical protein